MILFSLSRSHDCLILYLFDRPDREEGARTRRRTHVLKVWARVLDLVIVVLDSPIPSVREAKIISVRGPFFGDLPSGHLR